MKNITFKMLAIAGVVALATPAAAQIVNGVNGPDSAPAAPIGAKAGGPSAAGAPGEAAAMVGAKKNNRDFKTNNTGDVSGTVPANTMPDHDLGH